MKPIGTCRRPPAGGGRTGRCGSIIVRRCTPPPRPRGIARSAAADADLLAQRAGHGARRRPRVGHLDDLVTTTELGVELTVVRVAVGADAAPTWATAPRARWRRRHRRGSGQRQTRQIATATTEATGVTDGNRRTAGPLERSAGQGRGRPGGWASRPSTEPASRRVVRFARSAHGAAREPRAGVGWYAPLPEGADDVGRTQTVRLHPAVSLLLRITVSVGMIAVLLWRAPDIDTAELVPEPHDRHVRLARRRRGRSPWPAWSWPRCAGSRCSTPSASAPACAGCSRTPWRASSCPTSCPPPSAATSCASPGCHATPASPPTRSRRSCSSGSPAGWCSPSSPWSASRSTPACVELGTATTVALAARGVHPGPARRHPHRRLEPALRRPLRRCARAGGASPAPSISASPAPGPPPLGPGRAGRRLRLPVRARALRRRRRPCPRPAAGRSHRAARVLPGRAHRAGPAHRHLGPRHPRGCVRALPRTPRRRRPSRPSHSACCSTCSTSPSASSARRRSPWRRPVPSAHRPRRDRSTPVRDHRPRSNTTTLGSRHELGCGGGASCCSSSPSTSCTRSSGTCSARRARATTSTPPSPSSTPARSSTSSGPWACTSRPTSSSGTSTSRPWASSASGTSSTAPPTSSSPPAPCSGCSAATRPATRCWRTTLGLTTARRPHRVRRLLAHAAPPARRSRAATARASSTPPSRGGRGTDGEKIVDGCDRYGYVDTLAVHGGWISFDDEKAAEVTNQYAAMPSMHMGWSTWSMLVLLPHGPPALAAGAGHRCIRA